MLYFYRIVEVFPTLNGVQLLAELYGGECVCRYTLKNVTALTQTPNRCLCQFMW